MTRIRAEYSLLLAGMPKSAGESHRRLSDKRRGSVIREAKTIISDKAFGGTIGVSGHLEAGPSGLSLEGRRQTANKASRSAFRPATMSAGPAAPESHVHQFRVSSRTLTRSHTRLRRRM